MDQPALDIEAIMQHLPHRFPFLMIDRVLKYGGSEVLALKNVSLNEGFFTGHFPGKPIMPGVMIGECMAQSAAFLGIGSDAASRPVDRRQAMLSSIELKLHKPVVPGDQLWIHARQLKKLGRVMRVSASALVAGEQVASAEFTVVFEAVPAGDGE